MSKMLIVDDEEKIRAVVREYAEFEDFEVEEARDGMEAVNLCREKDYDIIIMDVMMPRLDGYSACKEIKKLKNIPIIMLSARGEEYDKLFGFETGIDDYVVKPFSPRELMARVRAVLARSQAVAKAAEETQQRLKFGGLEIDLAGREVYVDGKRAFVLTLQAREQHIRREKAGSNICSNQALCALTAACYLGAVGPEGLREVARQCYDKAHYFADKLASIGLPRREKGPFFHEFATECPGGAEKMLVALEERDILGGQPLGDGRVLWCETEKAERKRLDEAVAVIREVTNL